MMVHMDCAGCGSRLKKALEKLDGMLPDFCIYLFIGL